MTTNRADLMRLAMLPFYAGPLLAGLARHDLAIMPVFTAVFLLWLVVMRPHIWPDRAADWLQPQAIATLAGRMLVQFVLVALLLGLGRAIGALAGVAPVLPVIVPVALSFGALAFARAVWNPVQQAEMEAFLGEAVTKLNTMSAQMEDATRPLDALNSAALDKAAERLAPLPGLEYPQDIVALIAEVPREEAMATLDVLDGMLAADTPNAARAMVLTVTRPETALWLRGLYQPGRVYDRLAGDPAMRALFVTQAEALLDAAPDVAPDFPEPVLLYRDAALIEESEPDAAGRLRALAARLESLIPSD